MKTRILAIGRHPEILETLLRLINQNPEWEAKASGNDGEAISLFQQHVFDLVLLGGGISEEEEQRLRSAFIAQNPGIVIIQHYGGGSGLLNGEIREALDRRNKG